MNNVRTVILYDEQYGEVMRDSLSIACKEDAEVVAQRLLAPYMATGDTLVSWTCSVGTNFNVQHNNAGCYSGDAVLVRGLL